MTRIKQSPIVHPRGWRAPLRIVITKQTARTPDFPATYVVHYENMIEAREAGNGLFMGHHGLLRAEALEEYETRLAEISRPKPVVLSRLRGLPT
jgi:hypothetical protein